MDLWDDINKITGALKNHYIKILIFDFDGTLSPISKSPQEVVLSSETKNLLEKLHKKKGVYVAIISGRNLNDLKNKVGIKNLIYGGNHGLEGKLPDRKYNYPIPTKILKAIEQVKKKLKKITSGFSGTFIEDKGSVLSFHYRGTPRQSIPAVKLLLNKIVKLYVKKGLIKVIAGKKVYEIFPNVNWNKGEFANLMIKKISSLTKDIPLALFIGDDKTDEDVFRKLRGGITIRVGNNIRSNAKYTLKNTKEVSRLLSLVNDRI